MFKMYLYVIVTFLKNNINSRYLVRSWNNH